MSITLDGTNGLSLSTPLAVTSGGTGTTTYASGGILYSSNTSNVTSSNSLTFNGSQLSVAGAASFANTISAPNTFGFKNRLMNGQFQIAQRANTGTSGSGSPTTTATYSSLDRWFAYGTGATVTFSQVSGSGNIKNLAQITGASSVTAAGIGQRIEAVNCYDMAGQIVTLSAYIADSTLTTVNWTVYYAGSTDTWSSSTQIATGSWTVNSTLTQYNAQIAIPSAANTGLQVVFSVGAQTSGTLQIGNAQLELGSQATPFDYRNYGHELFFCQRYYQRNFVSRIYGSTNNSGGTWMYSHGTFHQTMRSTPSMGFVSGYSSSTAVDLMGAGLQNYSSGSPSPKSPNAFKWDIVINTSVGNNLFGTVVNDMVYADSEL